MAGTADHFLHAATVRLYLRAGDYIELIARHNLGSDLNVNAADNTWMQLTRVGDYHVRS